jgi:hypothetical protein
MAGTATEPSGSTLAGAACSSNIVARKPALFSAFTSSAFYTTEQLGGFTSLAATFEEPAAPVSETSSGADVEGVILIE